MQALMEEMDRVALPVELQERIRYYYRTLWDNYQSLDGKVVPFATEVNVNLKDEIFLFLRTQLITGN